MPGEPRSLVAIIEGKGERKAVPALLRRVSWEVCNRYDFNFPEPVRARNSGDLIKRFEDLLRLATLRECNSSDA